MRSNFLASSRLLPSTIVCGQSASQKEEELQYSYDEFSDDVDDYSPNPNAGPGVVDDFDGAIAAVASGNRHELEFVESSHCQAFDTIEYFV